MADIKKFTGFIAPDGSTHKTASDAIAYTRDLKIKEALNIAAQSMHLRNRDDRDHACLYPDDIAEFLIENMDAIQKAFSQSVVLRDRAKPKKAKKVPVDVAPSVTFNVDTSSITA